MNRNYEFGAGYDPRNDDLTDAQHADAAIFGELRDRGASQMVARSTPVVQIWPDPKQPRRAIPAVIRGDWVFHPDEVGEVLNHWIVMAGEEAGEPLDVVSLVVRGGEGLDVPERGLQVYAELVELIRLAASIHRDGLNSPITIARHGADRYLVESGERRLLAHHLLRLYVDAKYERVPAIVKDRADVWKQAAENGARRPLNAIGMARQLAILIMDMYETDPDVAFDEYEDIVYPGECDRRFYAQVRNGTLYRIKRGMGQRVLDVTGLKSRSQISQYRELLAIPDDLWVQADVENWTEGRIRAAIDEAQGTNRAGLKPTEKQPKSGDTLPSWQHIAPESGDSEPVGRFGDAFSNQAETVGVHPPPSPAPAPDWADEDEWRGDEDQDAEPFVMQAYPLARAMLRRMVQAYGVTGDARLAAEQFLKLRESNLAHMVETSPDWAQNSIDNNARSLVELIEAECEDFLAFVEHCKDIISEMG